MRRFSCQLSQIRFRLDLSSSFSCYKTYHGVFNVGAPKPLNSLFYDKTAMDFFKEYHFRKINLSTRHSCEKNQENQLIEQKYYRLQQPTYQVFGVFSLPGCWRMSHFNLILDLIKIRDYMSAVLYGTVIKFSLQIQRFV